MIGPSYEDDIQRACSFESNTFFYQPKILTKIPIDSLIDIIKQSLHHFPFPSEKKTLYFHQEKEEKHFLLQLLFLKCIGNQYIVTDATLFRSEERLTKEQFLKALQKRPLVVDVNKKQPPALTTPIDEAFSPATNTLQLKKISVHLSREIMLGILGHRGANHNITVQLLQVCLEKNKTCYESQLVVLQRT